MLGPKDGDKEPDKPQGRMHAGEGKTQARKVKGEEHHFSDGARVPERESKQLNVTSPWAHWDPMGIIPGVHALFCSWTLRALGPLQKALSAARAGQDFQHHMRPGKA